MIKSKSCAMAVAASMAIAPGLSSASVFGYLGNFDVINDTGSVAHGFEIDLEGVHSYEITDTFGGEGRGFPSGRGFDPAYKRAALWSALCHRVFERLDLRHESDLLWAV